MSSLLIIFSCLLSSSLADNFFTNAGKSIQASAYSVPSAFEYVVKTPKNTVKIMMSPMVYDEEIRNDTNRHQIPMETDTDKRMFGTMMDLLMPQKGDNKKDDGKKEDGKKEDGFFTTLGKGIQKEIADAKHPVEATITNIGSSQCSNVKKIVGVAYEAIVGELEPDVNQLTLNYITLTKTIAYNITAAAWEIPHSADFNPNRNLFIYIHGFTDDPTKSSFTNIRETFFKRGEYNVFALDGSSLIHWLYLRASIYVRFMGEKLGEVLAALVHKGLNPSMIHLVGHSLGSQIAGFAGKMFTKLTGMHVGRISGLDPAGPCFSHIDEDLRLNATDAAFVDVIHTDAGVFGIKDQVGHVDYYPNDGSQQPNCLFQTCSHSRAWVYYAESVINPYGFPAVPCDSWDAFKKGRCGKDVSYMGFESKPGTRGKYYLQTADSSPYALGMPGTVYKNDESYTKKITSVFG